MSFEDAFLTGAGAGAADTLVSLMLPDSRFSSGTPCLSACTPVNVDLSSCHRVYCVEQDASACWVQYARIHGHTRPNEWLRPADITTTRTRRQRRSALVFPASPRTHLGLRAREDGPPVLLVLRHNSGGEVVDVGVVLGPLRHALQGRGELRERAGLVPRDKDAAEDQVRVDLREALADDPHVPQQVLEAPAVHDLVRLVPALADVAVRREQLLQIHLWQGMVEWVQRRL